MYRMIAVHRSEYLTCMVKFWYVWYDIHVTLVRYNVANTGIFPKHFTKELKGLDCRRTSNCSRIKEKTMISLY